MKQRIWLTTLIAAATLAIAQTASAEQKLVPAGSEIGFVSKQLGVPVEGRFKSFDAAVDFDPKKPESGKIRITIDLASASIGAPETEAELKKPEWFDTAKFPRAQFDSTGIKSTGAGRFEVAGKLTIKGTGQDVTVPVVLTQKDGTTRADGTFTIKRLAFRIGDGEWKDPSVVADEVQVRFKLALTGVGPL